MKLRTYEYVMILMPYLDSNRIYCAANFKCALLELHDGGVVDAGTLREDQDRQLLWVFHVFPQSMHS